MVTEHRASAVDRQHGTGVEMTAPLRRDRQDGFARRRRAGTPATAVWVTMGWPHVMELLGAAGVDAAFVDLQHVSYGLGEAQQLIMAAETAGVSAYVRPTRVDRDEVSRVLDAGASGVVFPEVADAETARAAVATLRYPPRGVRGWGGAHTRFAGWQGGAARNEVLGLPVGGGRPVHNAEFLARAEQVACVVIVESVRGVERIDEILDVEGLDGVIFGWGDYSVEVGFDGQSCDAAARRVYEACRRRGIGVAVPYSEAGREQFYPGCFSIIGVDTLMFSAGIHTAVNGARKHWS